MEGRILLTRKLLGLLAAGPVAVLAFSLLPQLAFWLLVASPPGDLPAHSPMGWRHVRSFLIDIGVVTAYDLPIAMFVTLVLGLPLWLVAERLGWHGRRGAVRLGALAGLIVFLALFVQMLLDALQVRPEGEYSAFGGWRGGHLCKWLADGARLGNAGGAGTVHGGGGRHGGPRGLRGSDVAP